MAYLGAIFLAHPAADVPPKSTPDEESLAAGWFTLDEAERLPLREQDVLDLLRHVHDGGPSYPISLLAAKGEAFRL
jgi:phosphatase NudJ